MEEADLGVNFFLDEASLGKPRAQCCTELLSELNPEVQSSWYPRPDDQTTLEGLLESQPSFTIVLFTFPLTPERLGLLEAYGMMHSVPLVAVHSVGLYSYFRVVLPKPLPIIDTHPPEEAVIDLRLLSPWPELSHFARDLTKNIDALSDHEHGHLPFVVILLYYLEEWKVSHAGKLPTTYSDKVSFRKMVAAAARTNNAEGVEENFEEACAAVLRAFATPQLPSNVREAFGFEETNPVSFATTVVFAQEAARLTNGFTSPKPRGASGSLCGR